MMLVRQLKSPCLDINHLALGVVMIYGILIELIQSGLLLFSDAVKSCFIRRAMGLGLERPTFSPK